MFLINYIDTCQIVIGVDVAFRQILDKILAEGPSLSLDKLKSLIKSKP
jgi:hypothetical protein